MHTCRSLLKISHLAVELNHRALPVMQSEKMKVKNIHHFLRKATEDGWDILPVDKHHDLKGEDCHSLGMSPMTWRNQGIREDLEVQLVEHGMMIVGASHLYGLMGELKKIEKTHHVVYLNTLSFKGHPHAHALEYSWANDSKFVEQLTVAEIDEQIICENESVTRNKV